VNIDEKVNCWVEPFREQKEKLQLGWETPPQHHLSFERPRKEEQMRGNKWHPHCSWTIGGSWLFERSRAGGKEGKKKPLKEAGFSGSYEHFS